MKDIVLVEDNEELAHLIQTFLVRDGYTVCRVSSGEEALAALCEEEVKILLLDIMLPGLDGFSVCRKVREQSGIPILIISAKSEKEDKLTGYELGADDYVEKPLDPDLLSAKVRALMQRSYGSAKSPVLTSGGIVIDADARKVYLNEREIECNTKEFELLLLFIKNPGKTLHKEYIFGQIWGMESFSELQTLTVHVQMLRSKIEEDKKKPKRIHTVWGVGYRYEEL